MKTAFPFKMGIQTVLENPGNLSAFSRSLDLIASLGYGFLELNIPFFSESVLNELFNITEGLGLSSPNDMTDEAMRQLADFATKNNKFRVIHAAEAPDSKKISVDRSGLTEIERAIRFFDVNLLVHLTYALREDLDKVAKGR